MSDPFEQARAKVRPVLEAKDFRVFVFGPGLKPGDVPPKPNCSADMAAEPKQETLSFALREQAPRYTGGKSAEPTKETTPPASELTAAESPASTLLEAVRCLLARELREPRTEVEIAEMLGVSKPQAKVWLVRLVKEGAVTKLTKPTRFQAAPASGQSL